MEVRQVEKQKVAKQEMGETNIVNQENKVAEQKQTDTPVVQLQNNKDESTAIGKEQKENQAQSLKNENKDTEKVNQARRQRMRVS